MTIRLLALYQGNPPNTIVTLAGGTETALVAAGNATTDLSGGVPPPLYVAPANSQIGDVLYGSDAVPLGIADRTGKLLMNFSGITVPGAPTGVTLTPIAGGVMAAFTPSATLGGTVGVGYEVTLSNGRVQRGASSPIPVLSPAGVAVTATVKQINGAGLSAASTASASATPTAYTVPAVPGAPTSLTLTAGNGKVTATWTAAASNGSALRNTVVTLSNGASATAAAGATTVDVITPNDIAVTATARANNGEGAGPVSAVSNSVTPVAAPTSYTYAALPRASTTLVNTIVTVSDYPGTPNKAMVNNGLNWEPYPVAQVRQHINTRDGNGLCNTTLAGNGTQNSINQGVGIKAGGPATAIKVLFSNNGKQTGGAEIVGTGLLPTIESSFGNATKYRNLWEVGGGVSKSFASGEEAWAVADAGFSLTDGQVVSFNQHIAWPTVPTNIPCQANGGLMSASGPYATYDVSARGVDLADLTMGTMPTSRITAGAVVVPKAITGLTNYRPVVALLGDSNRLWARLALAQAGIRWMDMGIDGWTMESLAAVTASTALRYDGMVAAGVTHALITMTGGDITAGKSYATIMGYRATIQARCESLGIIPIFCTTPPKTTADETAVVDAPKWAVIQAYNAETRANSKYGYLELFDQVGSRTTGLWLHATPATVGDGIHMLQAVHDEAVLGILPQIPLVLKQG